MSDYDYYDAQYDAHYDAFEEALAPYLSALVNPIIREVEEVEEDQPRPWTYPRHLAELCEEEGEDALQETLEEALREQAEEDLRGDGPQGPCCNDFSCPCGNSNSFRGF